ncbi:hypothetical protein F2P81_001895 [Scophthalmus maximus]|uniref:Uncharacterized protein n=1 Tax=Scophthalmus maximus TaxID=52904 RepID=A0A6A4TCN4_SCOMX|nr:hypothetical protein F2P81_001895 [Scophthalmus maximus]
MGSSHASVKQMEEDSGDVNLKRQHVDDLQRDEGDADRDDEKGDDDEDRTSCIYFCFLSTKTKTGDSESPFVLLADRGCESHFLGMEGTMFHRSTRLSCDVTCDKERHISENTERGKRCGGKNERKAERHGAMSQVKQNGAPSEAAQHSVAVFDSNTDSIHNTQKCTVISPTASATSGIVLAAKTSRSPVTPSSTDARKPAGINEVAQTPTRTDTHTPPSLKRRREHSREIGLDLDCSRCEELKRTRVINGFQCRMLSIAGSG